MVLDNNTNALMKDSRGGLHNKTSDRVSSGKLCCYFCMCVCVPKCISTVKCYTQNKNYI